MGSASALPLHLPGDKSIAHRALLLAGLADSPSEIERLPDGEDVTRTAAALVALGVGLTPLGVDHVRVMPAPWRSPTTPIDCGNSGTLARLLLGVLAGERISASLVGDASLSCRPMRRVTAPLTTLLGASVVDLSESGTLPAHVRDTGPCRRGHIVVETGVPSAQVKSALLLAARNIEGTVCIVEPVPTRDHTERMLTALGVPIETDGLCVRLEGPMRWRGTSMRVPGDPSSAAFLAVAAAATGRGVRIDDVLLNPRRLGFVRVLRAMGAQCSTATQEHRLGEAVGTLEVGARSVLTGANVAAGDVPDLIDEVPALVALALLVEGNTVIPGLAELRVKESDRLARLVELATVFGGRARIDGDVMHVEARATATTRVEVRTDSDHRIAMAAHVLGRVLGADVVLDVPGCERTSFPGFLAALDAVLDAVRQTA